jgi:[protein-PII] uridylyltransferase
VHYDNIEFTISLLDCRYVAGDARLFARLHEDVLPRLLIRERQPLVQRLAQLAHERHAKYGNTIFHLEPNLKETPGGLRDYHVAGWLTSISSYDKHFGARHAEALFPAPLRDGAARAVDFLFAARCFLHYRNGRDDNELSWDAQDEAAAVGVGVSPGCAMDPGAWMRAYFRHVRSVSRLSTHLLDEVPPARSNLYRAYQQWRSRVSNADFSVVHGRVYLQQPSAVADISLVLRLFEFVARHGFSLSPDLELRIGRILPAVAASPPPGAELWPRLREILSLPHAARALRAMHALGLLALLVPELQVIDALVIRDFYHRYTVDEHTFVAIESLHALREPQQDFERPYADLRAEIDRPDLLFLALLLHDVGKGMPTGNHVEAGMPLVETAMARLQLKSDEREFVRFLVEQHLQISEALRRRDIFDPETIRVLAAKVGTTERLKALCLLTFADIRAANPDALKSWRAEDIWYVFVQTSNYLDRSMDESRLSGTGAMLADSEVREALRAVPDERRADVAAFTEGLPRRYLLTRSPETMASHAEMASRLAKEPVQLSLQLSSGLHQLTVLMGDRPGLFATIAGVLTAWGLDIVRADAFSNAAGIILDTFYFQDPFHTLELNPSERARFPRNLTGVLLGEVALAPLLSARLRRGKRTPPASQETRITLNNDSSAHSTIIEVVAHDHPGLLYTIASVLNESKCNIEVALIDTQGHVAVDVFYITAADAKLTTEEQEQLREALLQELKEEA